MNVVVNNLGKEINRENELLEILGIIYSMELSGDDKYEQLFKIDPMLVDEELKEGLDEMCNLGLLVFEDGIEKGRAEARYEEKIDTTFKNILSMMNKLHYSLVDAMRILDVDENDYSIYEEKFNTLTKS